MQYLEYELRIVMVTDDGATIDRRILLEAETLMNAGHEVILLARDVADVSKAQIIDGLKLERLNLNAPKPFELRYSELATRLAPVWLKKAGKRTFSIVDKALFTGKAGAVMLMNINEYNRWNVREKKRQLLSEKLSRRQRYKVRLFQVVRLGIAGFAAVPLGVGKFALMLRDRLVYSRSRAFEPNTWDRAIARRIAYYDPDIIHVHDLPQLYGAVLAKRRLGGVPLVYDTHEIYTEIGTLTPEQKTFLEVREKKLLRECDQVFGVNPYSIEIIEKKNNFKKIGVVMNATCLPEGFQRGQSDNRIREELGLGQEARILLFQGWIGDVGRGLKELILSMTAVRNDVHLVLLGYGDIEMYKEIAAMTGASDRIHFLDPVPWDELVYWSASSDVGVIPYQPIDINHSVCSPNKLFEFIAARLPILANNLVFLKHVVEGEGFGIARPMDTPENMAAAINEMFDPEHRHIERAQENLAEKGCKYEWREESKKLLRIYAKLPLIKRYKNTERSKQITSVPQEASH